MAIISFGHVDGELDEKERELETVKKGIELDEQELDMRKDIRRDYPQMLKDYEDRTKELESTLAHEQKLLDSLDAVQKPFEDMQQEVAEGREKATADARSVVERDRAALSAAQCDLDAFAAGEHEGEDAEELTRRRESLEYVLKLRKQALDAAEEELKAQEAKFDESQKPVLDNISAVKSNRRKHEEALRAAEIELEDIAIKRSYVNDCIADTTGDDEIHDQIRRKQERIGKIAEEKARLQKQRHTLQVLDRILWVCLIVFLIFLIAGIFHISA